MKKYCIQQEVRTVAGLEWRPALYRGKQAEFDTEDEALAALTTPEYGKNGSWRMVKIKETVLWTKGTRSAT